MIGTFEPLCWRSQFRGAVGSIVFLFIFASWIVGGFVTRAGILVDLDQRLTFFGISLPWLAVVLIYIGSLLFFVYLAARRRMGSDRIHPLSKGQAIAGMLMLSILLVGGIWEQNAYDVLQIIAVLYLMVIASIFAILTVTPGQAEYVKDCCVRPNGDDPPVAAGTTFAETVCSWRFWAIVLVTGTITIWRAATAPGGFAGRGDKQLSDGDCDDRARRRLFRPGDAVFPASIRAARKNVLRALSVPGLDRSDGCRHDFDVRLDASGHESIGPDHL